MAIYSSSDELSRLAGRTTSRWKVMIMVTAFLALIYFLQSESAADRLVVLQDVVKKNASFRGNANKTTSLQGLDITHEELEWNDDDNTDDKPSNEPEKKAEVEDNISDGLVKVVVSLNGNDSKVDTASDATPAEVGETVTATEEETSSGGDLDAPEEKTAEGENKDNTGLVKVVVASDGNDSKVDTASDATPAQEGETVTATKEEMSSGGEDQKTLKPTSENGEAKVIAREDGEGQVLKEDDTGRQNNDSPADKKPNDCSSQCSSRVQQHKERWGGDLLNIDDVKRLAKQAHDKFTDQLKVGYGEENFAKIFEKDGGSRGRTAFLPANPDDGISLKRFKRKLKMKVLSAQVAIQEELDSFGECNCKMSTKQSNRRSLEPTTSDQDAPPFSDHYERLVWSTGGHSSAAGHGNLFNESYTAVMEQTLTGIFGAIGIEFEGRSNAMGGTNGAPEIALCEEAIMGTDIDILSWDYGMTDGRMWDRKGMYANRAGLNPNRPAIIDMFIDTFVERRTQELRKVEERGLTALYMNPDAFQEMREGIPDTFGLTSEQIDAMPHMVRHFKCQDSLEKGDPTCDAKKYDNDDVCPKRKNMASWHPGWKLNALWGNTMALFMSEMLLEALTELGSTSDRAQVLRHLRLEEDLDYKTFFESDLPEPEKDFLKYVGNELLNETDVSIFFRSPSICHTARLPAQTRYLGILTESEHTGVQDYDKGIPKTEAHELISGEKEEMPMPLTFDEEERQSCEYELNRDYKDYFFSSDKMGWTTLTFPNKAEQLAYERESEKYLGLIILCPKGCDWGRCPTGTMQKESIQKGQVKFEINAKPVVNITDFLDCGALRGDDGHYWQPNDNGQYVLKAKVLGDGSDISFLRISSLILL